MPRSTTDSAERLRPARRLTVLFGAFLVLAGLALLTAVFAAIYGTSPEAEASAFGLGLGGAALLSALSQIAVLSGSWLVWRSIHRRG